MKTVIILLTALLRVTLGTDRIPEQFSNNRLTPQSVQSRIFRGVISNWGTFPYMVPIFITLDSGADSFCGGSLISDQYVLTAAHCLAGVIKVRIYLGAGDISSKSEADRMELKIGKDELIIHENYDAPNFINDIALIRLPKKIQFSENIQPIRLARRSQTDLIEQLAILSGWGKTGNAADRSNVLRYARKAIVKDEQCMTIYRNLYHPSNICIDGREQSICSGDSGGAAVIIDREDKGFTQIGVASYVHSSGCELGLPVSYTRITSYLDWISKHTGIPIRD
uniref:Venom polypeptide n=1 Tax=Dolopus genitalis TaxID=2488630 RepID=A0A3G5BIK6_DOLGE|nr:venom polypeptide [Dolopus genitalis]